MSAPPRVSVLIRSHRPDLLAELKASLRAQDHQPFQILTNEYAHDYESKLNDLAKAAVGEFYLVVPDDDLLAPVALSHMLKAVDATGADIAYSDVQQFGDSTAIAPRPPFTLATLRQEPPCWVASLVRGTLWRAVGGHPPIAYGDWAFWYECYKRGAKAVHIPETLYHLRVHADSGTAAMDREGRRAAARAEFYARYPELAA